MPRERPQQKEMLPTVYQPGGEKSTRNELMELRGGRGLPAREMVAVVQELYPKYDKTMQSKCEHGEEYGVLLRPDALTALYSRFAPDVLEARKRSRHGKHRLTCRVTARLEDALFAAFASAEAFEILFSGHGYSKLVSRMVSWSRSYSSGVMLRLK